MKYDLTFDNIRKHGDLLLESVRGSHLFGLNTETSDIDTCGLYCVPEEYLLGFRKDYPDVVLSESNDDSWYELGKFVEGLGKSNPSYLETIFTPQKWIRHYDPVLDPLWKIRDTLLTKRSFDKFRGYAKSQILKAQGLNKAMNTDPEEVKARKSPLDFCYVPYGQGTKKVSDWLRDHGLKQEYCGLVALPGMPFDYGLYYDWGTHLICEYGADLKNHTNFEEVLDKIRSEMDHEAEHTQCFYRTMICYMDLLNENVWVIDSILHGKLQPYGFRGIVKRENMPTEEEVSRWTEIENNPEKVINLQPEERKKFAEWRLNKNSWSNEIRLCTVPKGLKPLIVMSYNQEGYKSHCSYYKRYWEWVENRNPERYELNKGFNFDAKNMATCVRILTMAKEISEGKGMILDRTGIDREFLLGIKNHEMSYEEILKYLENLESDMLESFEKSTLPEEPDIELLDNVLVGIRERHYRRRL